MRGDTGRDVAGATLEEATFSIQAGEGRIEDGLVSKSIVPTHKTILHSVDTSHVNSTPAPT